VPGSIDVIVDEGVPIFSIGLGRPDAALVRRFHGASTKVIAMAATVDDAKELADAGVDAIIAQGHEAGGHRSTWKKRLTSEHAHIGTIALLPQIVRAVAPIPVLAAGGISDGRGLVAALALGAVGVSLGTRFVATQESLAVGFYKDALIRADSDSTTVTDAYTGLYARVLRNAFTAEYAASGAPVIEGYLQASAARDIISESAKRQDPDLYPMWAGQSVGMVNDLPRAAEIVERIMAEARSTLEHLRGIAV
jgi:nitronate monooxygenase